jgi:hypothetical protein
VKCSFLAVLFRIGGVCGLNSEDLRDCALNYDWRMPRPGEHMDYTATRPRTLPVPIPIPFDALLIFLFLYTPSIPT